MCVRVFVRMCLGGEVPLTHSLTHSLTHLSPQNAQFLAVMGLSAVTNIGALIVLTRKFGSSKNMALEEQAKRDVELTPAKAQVGWVVCVCVCVCMWRYVCVLCVWR